MAAHRDKFCITEPTRCTNFLNFFYFGMKLHMFRTVPLSIIKIFPLYTQQWYMTYRYADSLRAVSGWNILILLARSCSCTHSNVIEVCWQLSANLYDIYHCCVYSEKTPNDGQRNCPKNVEFHSKIKNFEKLVHLVGSIIRNI